MADILRWLVDHFRREGHVIRQAPVAFLAGLMILGAIIVAIVDWHYVGTDSAQRATIGMLQEELKGTSPQLAAIQARRIAIRDKLLQMYADSGELARRRMPVSASPEYRRWSDQYVSDEKKWETETAEWLRKNLGDAAKERFLDTDRGNYYGYTGNGELDIIVNRAVHLRQNLGTLIESGAYDK